MVVTKGKRIVPERVVIYGPEGVGKSTFASKFPNPLFIDTEGSTDQMDVARTPRPTSWSMLLGTLKEIQKDPMGYKTLVIDTGDWAQRLCADDLCSKQGKDGIEGFGYGKGFVYLAEEFGRFLDVLKDLSESCQMHIVITAHGYTRKYELPEEEGAYDKWELKLAKGVAPLTKEWATMVLFATYKTIVVVDDKTKKAKAHGASRIIRTQHSATWDAKNRHGLPDEIPLDYAKIAHLFPVSNAMVAPPSPPATAPVSTPAAAPVTNPSAMTGTAVQRQLRDLMKQSNISEAELQTCLFRKGLKPANTPIENLGDDWIKGCLISQWPKVAKNIEENEKKGVAA